MKSRRRWLSAAGLLILSICMIAYGAGRGEVTIVINKAVNICLECIGLG